MQGCGAQRCWQELQCRLERRPHSPWLTPFQPPLPGLDQADHDDLFSAFMGNTDVARETLALRRMVKSMQDSCAALEKVGLGPSFSLFLPIYLLPLSFLFLPLAQCPKPVIAAVHSACMGAGMDLVTACDIRLCSSETWFQIKVTERGGEGGRQRCCETRVCTPHTTSHYSSGICTTVTVQVHMLAVSFFLLFSTGGRNRVGCRHWHSAASAEGGGKCQSGTRAGLHCQEILS